MASLRILAPEGTTNYIENPAFRYDTTGWTAVGSAISRTLDEARFNVASLKVATTGSALYEGAYYRVSKLAGISEAMTGSAYVRGSGRVRIRLVDAGAGKEWTAEVQLRSDRWQRASVSGFSSGSDDVRLYVETADKIQSVTFYVDGAQVERHPYPTTYCDGDQNGCLWNVVEHGSISTRDGSTRDGGKWIELAGCKREEEDLYFTVVGGLGVAPIVNHTQPFANAPGSYYQNFKVTDRVITFTFFVRAPDARREANSRKKLHQLRETLFEIVKPDRTRGGEEFLLEYQDGDIPVYFWARYDGGLEGEWDVRNYWVESFPLRLLAVSPYLLEDDQEADALAFRERATVNYVMKRFDGAWGEMNGGFNTTVMDFALGSRGEIVACGLFNKANNKATATDPEIFANFICYWNGTQWVQMGTGANNTINAVAVAPNGDVVAVGNFTSIGGVAANRVARWVRATQTWTALDTGLNGTGWDVCIGPDGKIYVVGAFTTAGAITVNYCAYYDGSWHAMGYDPGLNAEAYCVDITQDGAYVYIGGSFTDESGNLSNIAAEKIVLYDVSSNLFFDMGDGFNDDVLDIKALDSGRVYVCGAFTEGATNGEVYLYIAWWNGAQWSAMDAGADDTVRAIDVNRFGHIVAVGSFTRMGSVDAAYIAYYNGTSWVNLDVGMESALYAVLMDGKDNIYTGASLNADYASLTTVENAGTAETQPTIYLAGPCLLRWIENQTAKVRVYADLEILDGEEVFIDFAKGTMTSTVRGDLAYAILPGSDIRSFTLLPGENAIAAMLATDTGAVMRMYHVPRHWEVVG